MTIGKRFSKQKYFEIPLCFDAKLLCFGFVLFQINFLGEEFRFVSKYKQFGFIMCSKPYRDKLDSSLGTSMVYTQAAFNTPSGHLPSSHDFRRRTIT